MAYLLPRAPRVNFGLFWRELQAHLSPESFFVGAYHGYQKPSSVEEYLKSLILEYTELKAERFFFHNEQYSISINAVICDSPARCMITCTKPHNAYFGCPRCTDEGDYIDNRMCFFSTSNSLRTNESFSSRLQEERHTGKSPLEEIGLNMISQFLLDPMHLRDNCLMKRILRSILK